MFTALTRKKMATIAPSSFTISVLLLVVVVVLLLLLLFLLLLLLLSFTDDTYRGMSSAPVLLHA